MKFNFVKNNKLYLTITLVLVILACFAVAIWGLKFGIDFRGGTILEYKFTNVDQTQLSDFLNSQNPKPSKILSLANSTQIYYEPLNDEQAKTLSSAISGKYKDAMKVGIETISSDTGRSQSIGALLAVLVASAGIILFLAYSFRTVPQPFSSWQFGISAVIALLHDAIVVIGIFAFLGHFRNVEIDLLFVTAILTVIGFSVHDTIVVFDRIREKAEGAKEVIVEKIIDESLHETFARSIILTLTAVIVLASLFLLGPISLKWFVGALLIGMLSGTYSSIFVASQLLILFQNKNKKEK